MTTERASAISLLMHEGSGFSCTVTGSDGQEQEILRLRNANRDSPETLEYIDWRYQSSPDAPEPRVFWLLSPDGQRIGQILLPETPSNLCFGGPKRNRLFITASQSLYAVYVNAQGAHIC